MTTQPHPDLRGRLRAAGAISTEVILGSRLRRWAITFALLVLVALVAGASAVIGLPFALGGWSWRPLRRATVRLPARSC